MRIHVLALAAGLCLAAGPTWSQEPVAASARTDGVSASNCWIRQLPAPVPSGGFLVLHNGGQKPVVLTGVTSADYGHIMMHQTTESGGVSSMSMVHDVRIPAGGEFRFAPGGYHLMLEEPRPGLKVGDTVRMDFSLADSQQFSVPCAVKPANTLARESAGHAHH